MLNKLFEKIEKNNDKIAYKINNQEITYGELLTKANEMAKALKCQGTSPVILYGSKSINMVISIIACLKANRAYVPIDTHVPTERIKKIISYTKSTLIIKNEEISININAENNYKECYNKEALKKEIDLSKETNSKETNSLKNIEQNFCEILTIKEVKSKYRNCKEFETYINNIAYIIFTSGSTGKPKGVPISYKNLNNFIKWISNFEILKNYRQINVLNQASFSFDLSVADFYYSIYNGHTLVGLDKKTQESYDEIFDVIQKNNINLMIMTPTFIKLLLVNEEFKEENFPSVKCMYFCGEQLEVTTVKKIKQKFKNVIVINAYGPTEATSAVSAIIIEEEMLNKEYLPVGKINTAATNISIEANEIILEGNSVFEGYLRENTGSYYKKNENNCYKTGDIGYIEDGLLYCKGRKDNQIKYKGYRIELGDIENNLLKIDGIGEAVVIAKSSENNIIKLIKAFIVIEKEIDTKYIKTELKKYLPEYMIPKNITILEKIPTNENGKYDRKKLKEL